MNTLSTEFLHYIGSLFTPTITQFLLLKGSTLPKLHNIFETIEEISRDKNSPTANSKRLFDKHEFYIDEPENIGKNNFIVFHTRPLEQIDKIDENNLNQLVALPNLINLDIDIQIEENSNLEGIIRFISQHPNLNSLTTTFKTKWVSSNETITNVIALGRVYTGDWYCIFSPRYEANDRYFLITDANTHSKQRVQFYLKKEVTIYGQSTILRDAQLRNTPIIYINAPHNVDRDSYNQIDDIDVFDTINYPGYSKLSRLYLCTRPLLKPKSRTYPLGDIVWYAIFKLSQTQYEEEYKESVHSIVQCKLIGNVYVLPFNIVEVEFLLSTYSITKIGLIVERRGSRKEIERITRMYPHTEIIEFLISPG